MQSHPAYNPLTASFLQRLDVEERLLNEALTLTADLYATLRKGELANIKLTQPRLEELAATLRKAARDREIVTAQLARSLGLKTEGLTLAILATRLGEPQASAILAQRERLTDLSAKLANYQERNANLIHHLRSYFRSVLSSLTKTTDIPIRYSARGECLGPWYGAAMYARG
jgi:FlgN protein